MDLSFIGELFGGGAIGGIIGAITPLVANAQKRKQKLQDDKHELELQRLGLQELELTQSHQLLVADKQLDIAEAETQGEVLTKELDIDLASVTAQGKLTGAIAWVRPALTGFLLLVLSVFTGWILYEIGGLDQFDDTELVQIFRDLIQAIITLAIAATMFWFSARQVNKG